MDIAGLASAGTVAVPASAPNALANGRMVAGFRRIGHPPSKVAGLDQTNAAVVNGLGGQVVS
jgi:hypothetical protein